MKLRIGTRGSDLALWQARFIAERLKREGLEVELVVIQSRGDRIADVPLQDVPGSGFFTGEIELALLEKHIDLAVHSHKDLPTRTTRGLAIAAVPARGSPAERLLAREPAYDPDAAFLPVAVHARVGTSSPRRAEQVRALRPDLVLEPLRGNVTTRVQKLREGLYDAILLAAAGLERLALDVSDLRVVDLPPRVVAPAPAQGALAVQVRSADVRLAQLCARVLHDERTALAVEAERALLRAAGGGCNVPLGALVQGAGSRWQAHLFLGTGSPVSPGRARWASAAGEDPWSAASAAFERAVSDEPTGCGPLEGRRVAFTGSGSRDSLLGERLEELGARVLCERVLDFESLAGSELAERVASLRRGDALAVTSRESARRLAGVVLPAGVLVAAVGSSTSRVLRETGLEPGFVGEQGAAELARALPVASGARVLFPCAEEALPDLELELRERGIAVERLPIYRTKPRAGVELDPNVEARVYRSPSAVAASLDWERRSASPALRIALGPTTAAALERAGLSAVVVEGGAEGIVRVLAARARPVEVES